MLGVRIEFFRQLLTDAGVQPELALRDAVSFSWRMSDASFDAFRAMKADQLVLTKPFFTHDPSFTIMIDWRISHLVVQVPWRKEGSAT